jgi:hypothetical protein
MIQIYKMMQHNYEYIVNTSRDISTYIGVSIVLILIFIISPISRYYYISLLGKCLVLFVLAFAIYKNTMNTNDLSSMMKGSMVDGNWDEVKTNVVCGYILSFFILVLLFTIFQRFF